MFTKAKELIMMGNRRLNLLTANQSNVEMDTTGFISATVLFERSNTQKLYGDYSLKITPKGLNTTEELSILVPVSVGVQYAVKANVWIPTGHYVNIAFDFCLNSAWKQSINETTSAGNDQWKSFTGVGICPATANSIKIALRRTANTDTTPFYYDGGIVEQSASIGNYADYYSLS